MRVGVRRHEHQDALVQCGGGRDVSARRFDMREVVEEIRPIRLEVEVDGAAERGLCLVQAAGAFEERVQVAVRECVTGLVCDRPPVVGRGLVDALGRVLQDPPDVVEAARTHRRLDDEGPVRRQRDERRPPDGDGTPLRRGARQLERRGGGDLAYVGPIYREVLQELASRENVPLIDGRVVLDDAFAQIERVAAYQAEVDAWKRFYTANVVSLRPVYFDREFYEGTTAASGQGSSSSP